MPGERFRNPNSRAISFTSWEPVAAGIKSGKKRASQNSRGVVTISFRRNPGKYTYVLNKKFTLREWLLWFKAGSGRSPGKRWNSLYLGRV